MDVIKHKILLEKYISRKRGSTYGTITANTININVLLTQDIKDMGMFNIIDYIEYDKQHQLLSYEPLKQKVINNNGNFNFISNPSSNFDSIKNTKDIRYRKKILDDYHTNGIIVTGLTEDRLELVSSYGYNDNNKYVSNFNNNKEQYTNYLGQLINSTTEITNLNNFNPVIYVEDANINDPNIGTLLQSDGFLLKTYTGETRDVNDPELGTGVIPITEITYQGQSLNNTNSSLSALTIEEYLLHITESPKVDSDIFIDRGITNVLQNHLQMGEISSLEQLVNYGNGYYNIIR
jgi:hypothetical protein